MADEIYNPLNFYANELAEKFRKVVVKTFEELVNASKIDVPANEKTVKNLREVEKKMAMASSRERFWRVVRVFLALIFVGGIAFPLAVGFSIDWQLYKLSRELFFAFFGVPAAGVLALLLWLIFVNEKVSVWRQQKNTQKTIANRLKDEAWAQVRPLLALFDWDLTLRMISQAAPILEFDSFFTQQRVEDLKRIFAWNERLGNDESVIFALSGTLRGNPFVFAKTLKLSWTKKTYYGQKMIHWTSVGIDRNGRPTTRHHSQLLTASYDAPFPQFITGTRLIYGNVAAPNLSFLRKKSGYADGGIGAWLKKRELQRFSRNLDDESQYTMMQNEEFEVAFDTKNRDNEQQFRLLFTPLAQRAMLELLRDKNYGFGDDFDFEKRKMINTITPEHLQKMTFETDPKNYFHYDFARIRQTFAEFNLDYFRRIYFAFAPLLCVPLYQQMRSRETIYGAEFAQRASFWEHESLANFYGNANFKHPACVTESILKTREIARQNGESKIEVSAHGFRAQKRVQHCSVLGADLKMHDVPVTWIEYLPVVGAGTLVAKEVAGAQNFAGTDFAGTQTAGTQEQGVNPRERARRFAALARDFGGIYRRGILSRLGD